MKLTINGQHLDFPDQLNIIQLLEQLDLEPEKVVIELNRIILTVDAHTTLLNNGDTLEIIQFVGGG